MKHLIAIVLLSACLTTSAMAAISARWDGPGRATITWDGPGCLYRMPADQGAILIACYPRDASYILELGHAGPLDGAYRPAWGDTYVIWREDGTKEVAALISTMYLPLTTKQVAPSVPPARVYLPVIRGG